MPIYPDLPMKHESSLSEDSAEARSDNERQKLPYHKESEMRKERLISKYNFISYPERCRK